MTTDKLLLTMDKDGIATITFNRPERRNALDTEAMVAFAEAVVALTTVERLRAVIVTGAGTTAFCSGADLHDMSQRPTEGDAAEMVTRMGMALLALERLPVPVIAAINGYALGGGSEIALACDLRIVDEAAQFGLVHLRRGLIPGWGGGNGCCGWSATRRR
ncbi:MAG: enoyl-CoA hydratase/isomerase family protein [Chloroflexi bacterium]|nr:enoyl-CoA hydratase/isomerase family protein [Chloroflexota bacterium]